MLSYGRNLTTTYETLEDLHVVHETIDAETRHAVTSDTTRRMLFCGSGLQRLAVQTIYLPDSLPSILQRMRHPVDTESTSSWKPEQVVVLLNPSGIRGLSRRGQHGSKLRMLPADSWR